MNPEAVYVLSRFFASSEQLSGLSRIFGDSFSRFVRFWRDYKGEFTFDGRNCVLKDLSFKLPVREVGLFLFSLETYFAERGNYRIRMVNDECIMEIDELEFALPFPNGIYELVEVFRNKCYGGFNVNGGVVVDVGAFIGDSAVYFAKEGASRVRAYEPVPQLYKLACKNVMRNSCVDKVEIRNCVVSDKYGTETLNVNPYWLGLSSMIRKKNQTFACPIQTEPLSAIIAELGDVALLKMDCEGLEYKLIPHAYKENALANVDQLVLEVHGPPQLIIDVLKQAGFDINCAEAGPNFLLRARKLGC